MVDGKTVEEIKKINIEQEFATLNLTLGASRISGVNSVIRFLQKL